MTYTDHRRLVRDRIGFAVQPSLVEARDFAVASDVIVDVKVVAATTAVFSY